jgi:hypothetical protein
MERMTDEPDPALSAEVESVFDPLKYGEVQITMRLPGACTDDGEPVYFTFSQLMMPEDIGIKPALVPEVIRRIGRIMMGAMRFR